MSWRRRPTAPLVGSSRNRSASSSAASRGSVELSGPVSRELGLIKYVWERTWCRPEKSLGVCDLLAAHLSTVSEDPRALVFMAPSGGPLRHRDFLRYVWRPAIARVGLAQLDIHELRHTAASLLIAAGADPKTVQEQLGHRSMTITYDVYGHLFEPHADAVMARLDAEARAAAAPMRPQPRPDVVELAADRGGKLKYPLELGICGGCGIRTHETPCGAWRFSRLFRGWNSGEPSGTQ